MAEEVQKPKRSFPCAARKAQAKLGLPYTCTAAPVSTVSAGRTHLTRKLPKGKPPHLPFLQLCKTCNEDILDEYEFETRHGKDGLKCETPRRQRKGDAGQQEQYDILCSKVEAYISTQNSQMDTAILTTAEDDATLLCSEPSRNDSVFVPELFAPSQPQDSEVGERPHPPTRSGQSPHAHVASENVSVPNIL
jgi:hypothetical protein